MASIAIMALGAVLNAAAFTGGNYLAKYLSGDSGKAALDEKTRHDIALEQYQAAYAKYQKDRTKLLDWIAANDRMKHQASQVFKSTDIIKEKAVPSKPATPYMRPVGIHEKKLPPQAHVRYLYYPGELEGGGRRATDPIWSLKVYTIQKVVTKPEASVVYYLYDGPKRGFVREELMAVPRGTQLPPLKSM